ncbi:MAG TPA: type II secretion system protein N [Burkholderiaceae bacterium]
MLAVLLTLLVFFPAAWMASAVEKQTGGRLTLGDATGTLWRGSAFVGGAPSGNDAVTPLLPGRFAWKLSPLVLLGMVDLTLENPDSLQAPVRITGSWSTWQVAPGVLKLPASGLAGLGAPLNTLAPNGRMELSWTALELHRQQNRMEVAGRTTLTIADVSSQLSSIRPLGSYRIVFDWRGAQASMNLATDKGPLLLTGSGAINKGRFTFSGQARAENGQEEALANLLNLLGQRRIEGGKTIIALEFK